MYVEVACSSADRVLCICTVAVFSALLGPLAKSNPPTTKDASRQKNITMASDAAGIQTFRVDVNDCEAGRGNGWEGGLAGGCKAGRLPANAGDACAWGKGLGGNGLLIGGFSTAGVPGVGAWKGLTFAFRSG